MIYGYLGNTTEKIGQKTEIEEIALDNQQYAPVSYFKNPMVNMNVFAI